MMKCISILKTIQLHLEREEESLRVEKHGENGLMVRVEKNAEAGMSGE